MKDYNEWFDKRFLHELIASRQVLHILNLMEELSKDIDGETEIPLRPGLIAGRFMIVIARETNAELTGFFGLLNEICKFNNRITVDAIRGVLSDYIESGVLYKNSDDKWDVKLDRWCVV